MLIHKRLAFTLAEVLITLGVIGIVAALTIPVLIANHRKQVVITRMRKFYTTINQAIKLSEADNGEPVYWEPPKQLDANSLENFWNKYMLKYFTSKDIIKASDGILILLADGSAFGVYNPASVVEGIDWMHIVYCVDYKSCKKHLENNGNKIYNYPLDGKNTFLFIARNVSVETYYSVNNSGDIKSRDILLNETQNNYGCAKSYKAYCAALIEYDGWTIQKDYPVRF